MIIKIGLAILLIAILYFVFISLTGNKKKVKKEEEPKKEETREEKENSSFKESVQKLLKINYVARKNIVDTKVLATLETTIDSIKEITEDMSKLENFSENSVMFERIVDRYLPELINNYIKLSQDEREKAKEKLILNLTSLNKEVLTIKESLSDSSKENFERTGKLIEEMFKKFEGEEK